MKLQDALNTLGLSGEITLEMAKAAYRAASMKYHPDRNPAGLQMMQAINAAWEAIKAADWSQTIIVDESGNSGYGDFLNDALNAVVDLDGISIEICGAWVWLSGNTYPHKAAIKAAGYRWASAKKMWYFRPEEWKSAGRGTWNIDKIRANYGSETVQRTRKSRPILAEAE